ncbi:hypothetical protein RYD26_12320, partial [Pasteurellaceae bacterium LIM206]|nr:hypothetical protein [Pasteurellaceae bacterium LIM206]
MRYAYDPAGRLIRKAQQPNNPTNPQSAVRIWQVFDRYGELSQFRVNDHNPLMLGYDKLGRQTRRQTQNGLILTEHFTRRGYYRHRAAAGIMTLPNSNSI